MPIPLIIPLFVGVSGIVAAPLTITAIKNFEDSESNNKKAEELRNKARKSLENARDEAKNALENLGNQKIEICKTSITKFVFLFEKIKNIELHDSTEMQELSKFKIDERAIVELKQTITFAQSVAQNAIGGSVAVGTIAFATRSAPLLLAGISTTALASGIVIAVNSIENLEKSRINMSKAQAYEEEVALLCTACVAVQKRATLFSQILALLDRQFSSLLEEMENVIYEEGTDFSRYTEGAKNTIAASLSLAQAVKAVLDTPILNQDGSISEDSKKVSNAICEGMNIEIPEVSTPTPDSTSDDTARLEEKIKELIVKQLAVPRDQVLEDARIVEDLNADSLDIVEFIMACEEEFGIEIPDEEAERLKTVGDVFEYAKRKGFKAPETQIASSDVYYPGSNDVTITI